MSLCCRIFIDILVVFHHVMTLAYDVSFVVDMYKATLSILLIVLRAFLEFSLILNDVCEVYSIAVLIPFCFGIV